MGANANSHHELRFDRAMGIFGVFGRRVSLTVGGGIGQLTIELLQGFNLLGGAAHDPHGFAAPFNGEFFTGFDIGNIDFNSSTGGFGALGRLESADKGGGDEACAYGASASRGNQPRPFAAVDWGITHENPLANRYQG